MSPKTQTAKVHLITRLADALKESLAANRTGEWSYLISAMNEETTERVLDSGAFAMLIRLRGVIQGELRIEAPAADLVALFSAQVREDQELGERWEALLEGAVRRLPKRAEDTDTFAFSVESHYAGIPCGGAQIARIQMMEAGKSHAMFRVLADAVLLESLRVLDTDIPTSSTSASAKERFFPDLRRVMDVPLSVTLRFGQRHMKLCDVLELNTGAVVELDRQVEDPVDLILDDRVIARGDVVIVDGNYGLRITEVVECQPAIAL